MDEMTISIPAAGKRFFSAGRNKSYELARQGIIVTIPVGGRKRVPLKAMEMKFQQMAAAADVGKAA
jgi:hypothetical protein